MKKITLLLLVILIGMPIGILADSRINLTPVPMQMTVGEGKLIMPDSFTISTGDLEEEAVADSVFGIVNFLVFAFLSIFFAVKLHRSLPPVEEAETEN